MSTILVTGSTGQLGSKVISHLIKRNTGNTIIGLARDESKTESLTEQGAEARIGDYEDLNSLKEAFVGVDKLIFISGSDLEKRNEHHKNIVEAAKKTGVNHIVYTSFQRETEDESSPIWMVAQSHLNTEKWIKESGITYTFLRNNLYMDFVPLFLGDQVIDQGTVYIPAGEGKMACLLRDDMAEATANILFSEGHENKAYRFAHTQSYSFADVAEYLSEISGKEINYYSPDADEYAKTMSEAGVPEEAIGMTIGFAKAIEEGELNTTNTDFEKLLGRKPVTLPDFLKKVYS